MSSVYMINKGINRPIEFKGLKSQYIAYLGVGLVALLILFAVLYFIGIHTFICLGIIAILGGVLFMTVYQLSDTYGQYGLLKKLANRNLPSTLTGKSRRLFLNLKSKV